MRAALIALMLTIASQAGAECGKLCDRNWWLAIGLGMIDQTSVKSAFESFAATTQFSPLAGQPHLIYYWRKHS
jgi:hypothetical protein